MTEHERVTLTCTTCGKTFAMPVKYAYIQTHRDKTLRPIDTCQECCFKAWDRKGEVHGNVG